MTAPLVARAARIEISLGNPPSVNGRRGRLVQVAVNLLRNAADALASANRPPDEGRIVLATRAEGAFAVLSVEDDGPGIAADLLARLPEPYLTTKPPDEGSGLGLSISERIVAELGGTLQIESTPGVGTRVEMRLPVAPS
jgi:C4-dicarboxylate-specific signal transduction histidine kinase